MLSRLRPCLFVVAAGLSLFTASTTAAQQQQKNCVAQAGGTVVCGDVNHSTLNIFNITNIGLSAEEVEKLIAARTKEARDLTEEQKKQIAKLEQSLVLNERQIRAALTTLGERNVPPENLVKRLVEIAQNIKTVQERIAATPTGDDKQLLALKTEAEKAITAGDLSKAEQALLQIKSLRREARKRLEAESSRIALDEAETTAQLGEISLANLQYFEAAKRFSEAAALVPPRDMNEKQRLEYLEREASALYKQGDEFGDNAALALAIDRYEALLLLHSRERVPLDWAMAQNNLGLALFRLGERESGTGKLEEAVSAYREALKEWTRARVPLDWAKTQNNLGVTLVGLGERENGTGKLEEAVSAFREALKELTKEAAPHWHDIAQKQLDRASVLLAQRLNK